VPEWRNW